MRTLFSVRQAANVPKHPILLFDMWGIHLSATTTLTNKCDEIGDCTASLWQFRHFALFLGRSHNLPPRNPRPQHIVNGVRSPKLAAKSPMTVVLHRRWCPLLLPHWDYWVSVPPYCWLPFQRVTAHWTCWNTRLGVLVHLWGGARRIHKGCTTLWGRKRTGTTSAQLLGNAHLNDRTHIDCTQCFCILGRSSFQKYRCKWNSVHWEGRTRPAVWVADLDVLNPEWSSSGEVEEDARTCNVGSPVWVQLQTCQPLVWKLGNERALTSWVEQWSAGTQERAQRV